MSAASAAAAAPEATDAAAAPIAAKALRRTLVFGADGARMVGCLHLPGVAAADLAVLICNPIGVESINGHRSIRHLADQLARDGLHCLRFDYPGTGDSSQNELDPDRLAVWTDAVVAAVETLRRVTGCARVAVVGIRLGAALAAMAAQRCDIEAIAFWNPVIHGRTHARELRAIAMLAGYLPEEQSDLLEVAGQAFTRQTIQDIRSIDLLQSNRSGLRQALIIEREEFPGDPSLANHLRGQGVVCEVLRMPGYERMVCEALFTQVPQATIDAVASWLIGLTTPGAGPAAPPEDLPDGPLDMGRLQEQAMRFGPGEELFGILCTPAAGIDPDRPLLLMLNTGSDHHVGPGRLSVKLARELGAAGFSSLRFDLAGLGDSAVPGVAEENVAVPSTALRDIRWVVDGLRRRLRCRRFVALGVCSGAYHAMRLAQETLDVELVDVLMLNPPAWSAFERHEGDVGGDTPDVAAFERRLQWRRRIATGGWALRVTGRLLRSAVHRMRHGKDHARSLSARVAARLGFRRSTVVAADLRRVAAQGRPLALFLASEDPSLAMLMEQAAVEMRAGMRRGLIAVHRIADSDHIFSSNASRQRLIAALLDHLDAAARSAGAQAVTKREASPRTDRRERDG